MSEKREPGTYWIRDADGWGLVEVYRTDEYGGQFIDSPREWATAMGRDAGTEEDSILEWGPRVLPPAPPGGAALSTFEAWVKENPDASLFSAYQHGLAAAAPSPAPHVPASPDTFEQDDIAACRALAQEMRRMADLLEESSAARDWLGVATLQSSNAWSIAMQLAGRASMRYRMTRGGR